MLISGLAFTRVWPRLAGLEAEPVRVVWGFRSGRTPSANVAERSAARPVYVPQTARAVGVRGREIQSHPIAPLKSASGAPGCQQPECAREQSQRTHRGDGTVNPGRRARAASHPRLTPRAPSARPDAAGSLSSLNRLLLSVRRRRPESSVRACWAGGRKGGAARVHAAPVLRSRPSRPRVFVLTLEISSLRTALRLGVPCRLRVRLLSLRWPPLPACPLGCAARWWACASSQR